MSKLYTYVLRYDDGAAPNPFWGICTLAICKPAIRRTAKVGDWVVGLGSTRARCNDGAIHDFSGKVVYAMRISEIMTLQDYDKYCRRNHPNKIPVWDSYEDWRLRMGDNIFDFSNALAPQLRASVHKGVWQAKRDLGGRNVLISDFFYYFGEKPIDLPPEFGRIAFQNQGHRKFEDQDMIDRFEKWIGQFDNNKLYADPQLRFNFDLKLPKNKVDTSGSCTIC